MAVNVLSPSVPALVTALCNQKGGVGKTTSTINLARASSLSGLSVLVVDLDPQGNTTSALAAEDLPDTVAGVADTLIPDQPLTLREALVPGIWPGVTLAPTTNTEALTEAESRMAAVRFGREGRLRGALAPELARFDLVLIDTPPSLGLLLINALAAAEFALINGKRHSAHHDRIVADIVAHYGPDRAWADPMDIVPLRAGISDHVLAGLGLDESREPGICLIAEAFTRFLQRLLHEGGRL